MKTSLFLLSMLVIGTLLVTSSCKKADIIATPTVTSQIVDLPKETLSSDELASLQQMREEENWKGMSIPLYSRNGESMSL